jgi:hypothetical protein
MKQGRPAMLLALLFAAQCVPAGNIFDAPGAAVFINIPLGGEAATRPAPSIGFDVDMPKFRRSHETATPRRKSIVPLEIELPRRGVYRVKVGGFYLDSLN